MVRADLTAALAPSPSSGGERPAPGGGDEPCEVIGNPQDRPKNTVAPKSDQGFYDDFSSEFSPLFTASLRRASASQKRIIPAPSRRRSGAPKRADREGHRAATGVCHAADPRLQ